MTETVLITGASGFLGYHLIQAAIEKGLTVFGAVRQHSNIDHLKELPVQWLYLNYEDEAEMARQITENNIDFIIHAAGITKAVKQEMYNHVNASFTFNLAKAAEKAKDHLKKMVFISSLAAVGPLPDFFNTITEETTPNPVTAYGRSKLLAEKQLASLTLPVTILRPTAIYGPRERDIFIMIKTINNGFDPYIGKFLQQLSFVHATDVASIAVNSLFLNNVSGIFNISDGNSYNRYQLSDISRILLNRKAIRFHLPLTIVKSLALFLETTYGWLNKPAVINREKLNELAAKNWNCDISKAKGKLDFSPKFNLQTGLEETLDWYFKNNWL